MNAKRAVLLSSFLSILSNTANGWDVPPVTARSEPMQTASISGTSTLDVAELDHAAHGG